MNISMPDPFPGRCRNHRPSGFEQLRCLDYDAVEHVCTFPEPKPDYPQGSYLNVAGSFTTTPPTPWIKPPSPSPVVETESEQK